MSSVAGKPRLPRLFTEWLILSTGIVVLALWLGQGDANSVAGRFTRLDAAVYDLANRARSIGWPKNTVLIEIDEASLARIGRWPWPRAVHAALLRQLNGAGVKVIGLDILLAESAVDDTILAEALLENDATVLAVASDMDREQRQWPIYPVVVPDQVTSIGHVHFGFDADGLVRGLYLVEGDMPAFALAIHARSQGRPAQALASDAHDAAVGRRPLMADTPWSRNHFVLLPRLDADGVRVSYADVLTGEYPLENLKNQTVIIGATAAGMRDAYSNGVIVDEPVAAGALLHVATLAALREQAFARRIDPWPQSVLTSLIVLATLVALYLLRPRAALMAVAVAMLATLGVSVAALGWGVWIPPGGIMLALLLAYPLWSWRRLEAVVGELSRQVPAMRHLPEALHSATRADKLLARLMPRPKRPAQTWLTPPSEPITTAVSALQQGSEAASMLRELLAVGLERLPHGALIIDESGEVLLSNRQAREAFPELSDPPADGLQWLQQTFGLPSGWRTAGSPLQTVERRDTQGRDWLVDAILVKASALPALWLVQYSNVTVIRAMQRQREDMLRFLSHDLRSPQVSILSAIEQLSPAQKTPLLNQIEHMARQALDLADGFVQWSVAEHKPLAADATDLVELATEAVDANWQAARDAGVRIELHATDEAPIRVDRTLLRRAINNLIENAIKYGRDGGVVDVEVRADDHYWLLTVADRGAGLPDGDPERLFKPYERGGQTAQRPGSGLGLAFVRLVAQRHGGEIRAGARPGGGALMTLSLPAGADD